MLAAGHRRQQTGTTLPAVPEKIVLRLDSRTPPPPPHLRVLLGTPVVPDLLTIDAGDDGLRLGEYVAVPTGQAVTAQGETADLYLLRLRTDDSAAS